MTRFPRRVRIRTTTILTLTALVASGCGVPTADLPVFPEVQIEAFSPSVREHLDTLQAQAERKPRRAASSAQLGMAYLAYRQDHAAETMLRRARLLEPGNFDWAYYHAEALVRTGDLQHATQALQDALGLQPGHHGTSVKLAEIQMRLGNVERARTQLQAVVDAAPARPQARLDLARSMLQMDQPDAALKHLQLLQAEYPNAGSVYFSLAEAWRRLGDSERATHFTALFERHRNRRLPEPDPLMDRVWRLDRSEKPLLREARRLNQQGRPQQAIAVLHEALQRSPDNQSIHASLVGAYGALKDFARADEHYARATAIGPPSQALWLNLGRARYHEGRYLEAANAMEQSRLMNPRDSNTLAWLGVIAHRRGKTTEAEAWLNDALQANTGEVLARFTLAQILQQQQRYDEARAHFLEMVEPESTLTAKAMIFIARGYLAQDQLAEAGRYLQSAIDTATRLGAEQDTLEARSLLRKLP